MYIVIVFVSLELYLGEFVCITQKNHITIKNYSHGNITQLEIFPGEVKTRA